MNQEPDFIGLGVEKAGTSWIFACLYEHPQICIPVKEIIFFSEASLWKKEKSYYEIFFQERCGDTKKKKGEFSTSYFYHEKAANRIYQSYPNTKLIVCLRNPIKRAFSNYLNDIKAGIISKDIDFATALKTQSYYVDQGKYKLQFERYFHLFKQEQIKILLYDDLVEAPDIFIKELYQFIGVDSSFLPSSLYKRINTGRVPNNVNIEKWSNQIAAFFQKSIVGEKIWWAIKQSGIPQFIRELNTYKEEKQSITPETYQQLALLYQEDILYVEQLLNRKLNWLAEL